MRCQKCKRDGPNISKEQTQQWNWYCVMRGPWVCALKDHGKAARGLPVFMQEASKLEPKGQIVSQKFPQHVFMFLQRYKVLLSRGFLRETQSSHCGKRHRPENKPALHSLKRTLGKYLKAEAAHGALQTTTPLPPSPTPLEKKKPHS